MAQYVMPRPVSIPKPFTVTMEPPATLTRLGVTELTLATATSSMVMELVLQSWPLSDTSTVVLPLTDATDMHSTTPDDTGSACTTVTPPIRHHADAPSSTADTWIAVTEEPPAMSTTDGSTRPTVTTP